MTRLPTPMPSSIEVLLTILPELMTACLPPCLYLYLLVEIRRWQRVFMHVTPARKRAPATALCDKI